MIRIRYAAHALGGTSHGTERILSVSSSDSTGYFLALSANSVSATKPDGPPGQNKPPPEPEPLPENPDILYGGLRVMNVLGESALVLADAGGGARWAPDGWHFVFYSGGGIYISDLEGTDPLLVTETPGDAYGLRWSPGDVLGTGEKMAFTCMHDPELFPFADIFLVNPDGTGLVNVTNTPDVVEWGPTWSLDGSRIAVKAIRGDLQPNGQLWNMVDNFEVLQLGFDEFGGLTVIDRRNINEEAAAAGVELPTDFGDVLDWANTGDRLAVRMTLPSGSREICVLDLDTYEVTELTGEGTAASFAGQMKGCPTWSGDDSRVAFHVYGNSFTHPKLRKKEGIYVVNSDGSGELIKLTDTEGRYPEWWAGGLP